MANLNAPSSATAHSLMHSSSFASVLSSSTENSNAAYPTLFRIAMDYLPIQASSVPCERVFSGSGETDTNRRSCTSPQLTGVLQVIKFARKKARLDFSFQYLTTAAQLESILHDVQKTKASLTPEGSDVNVHNLMVLFSQD